MKFSKLTKPNQELLQALEESGGKKRKQRARHNKQFSADPKYSRAKTGNVGVWEFLVDPFTPENGISPGRFRLMRRSDGSDVSWYWAKHLGNDSSFSFDEITDIPSFKPVKETEEEDTDESATPHTTAILERSEVSTIVNEEEEPPDSWESRE